MTTIGTHDVAGTVVSATRGGVSSDGALWLILLDGLVLVPLAFAAFFYPVVAAIIGAFMIGVIGIMFALSQSGIRTTEPDVLVSRALPAGVQVGSPKAGA
jgi:hypothetical protein